MCARAKRVSLPAPSKRGCRGAEAPPREGRGLGTLVLCTCGVRNGRGLAGREKDILSRVGVAGLRVMEVVEGWWRGLFKREEEARCHGSAEWSW